MAFITHRSVWLAAVLAGAAAAPLAARATTVQLAADGTWQGFTVDSWSSATGGVEWIDAADSNAPGFGSVLDFSFSIAQGQVGQLTVVDAGLAGDTFQVFNGQALLDATSVVPVQSYGSAPDLALDYDAALAHAAFSHGVFTLGAGSYHVTGVLLQSLMLDDGSGVLSPLNATAGAVRLSVSAVPEPSSIAMVLAALGLVWRLSRRLPTR